MAGYAIAPTLLASKIHEVYREQVAITPADATAIGPFMALYVGGFGDVTVVPLYSLTPVVFKAVAAGTLLRIAYQGVNLTGTNATNLVGLG